MHVTCTRSYTGEQVVKFTCDIYNIIKRAATNNVEPVPGQEFDLDNKLTCMHCRFYFENLTNVHDDINYHNQSKIIQIVKSSFQSMNDPVQLLGNPVHKGTTKYSVKGQNDYSVVNISFPNGKCYAKCQNGMCKARMQNKKKIQTIQTFCYNTSVFSSEYIVHSLRYIETEFYRLFHRQL